jgi:SAM-dependent methyltransferase
MSAAETAAVADEAALTEEILRYAGIAERLLGTAGGAVPAADLEDVRRFYAGHPDLPLLSRDGPVRSLHVPLTLGGDRESSGFLAQPSLVERVIEESPVPIRSVVELGCAEGFNTAFLARRFPHLEFAGYDLVPAHIAAARERLGEVPNARFEVADFHRLPASAGGADLVFSVESIIHSPDMAQLLRQVRAVLRPAGTFFVIELFRPASGEIAAELARARALTETLLAIPAMYARPDWIALAGDAGFRHVATTDLTSAALPGMTRLSRLFGRVLDRKTDLPDADLRSVLTALLICRTLRIGAHGLFAIQLTLG